MARQCMGPYGAHHALEIISGLVYLKSLVNLPIASISSSGVSSQVGVLQAVPGFTMCGS
jgi:hypothetical protein